MPTLYSTLHRQRERHHAPHHVAHAAAFAADQIEDLMAAVSAHMSMKRYMTTSDVAQLYSVSPEWVRDNAHALGGVRMKTDSRRSQWRFATVEVDAYFQSLREPAPKPRARRSRRTSSTVNDYDAAPVIQPRPVLSLA